MSFDDVARRMRDNRRQGMIPGPYDTLPDDQARGARAATDIVVGSVYLVVGLSVCLIAGATMHGAGPVVVGLGPAGWGVRRIIRGITA